MGFPSLQNVVGSGRIPQTIGALHKGGGQAQAKRRGLGDTEYATMIPNPNVEWGRIWVRIGARVKIRPKLSPQITGKGAGLLGPTFRPLRGLVYSVTSDFACKANIAFFIKRGGAR